MGCDLGTREWGGVGLRSPGVQLRGRSFWQRCTHDFPSSSESGVEIHGYQHHRQCPHQDGEAKPRYAPCIAVDGMTDVLEAALERGTAEAREDTGEDGG